MLAASMPMSPQHAHGLRQPAGQQQQQYAQAAAAPTPAAPAVRFEHQGPQGLPPFAPPVAFQPQQQEQGHCQPAQKCGYQPHNGLGNGDDEEDDLDLQPLQFRVARRMSTAATPGNGMENTICLLEDDQTGPWRLQSMGRASVASNRVRRLGETTQLLTGGTTLAMNPTAQLLADTSHQTVLERFAQKIAPGAPALGNDLYAR